MIFLKTFFYINQLTNTKNSTEQIFDITLEYLFSLGGVLSVKNICILSFIGHKITQISDLFTNIYYTLCRIQDFGPSDVL
jgi:hypothetical protein